jgi:aspartate aminotransferase
VNTMIEEYARRRQWLIPALNEVEGFKCQVPEGAFYAFVDVRDLLCDKMPTSNDVADRLLDEAHVVVTDGAGFGADGFVRISYATSMENLKKAVGRMTDVFAGSKRARVGEDDGNNRMGELDNIARNVG